MQSSLAKKNNLIDLGAQKTDCKAYLPDGQYRCNNWFNLPSETLDGQGILYVTNYTSSASKIGWTTRIFKPPHDIRQWITQCVNSTWGPWAQIATATPPREFVLPLASGMVEGAGGGRSYYWKTQDNEVSFLVAASATKSIADSNIIATLPNGFRPAGICIFSVFSSTSVYERKNASLNVKTNGEIVYYGGGIAAGGAVYGSGSFVAVT